MFRAEMFDPDEWADLFKKSGAKCEINQLLAIQHCKLIASRLSIKNEVLLYSLHFHQEDIQGLSSRSYPSEASPPLDSQMLSFDPQMLSFDPQMLSFDPQMLS